MGVPISVAKKELAKAEARERTMVKPEKKAAFEKNEKVESRAMKRVVHEAAKAPAMKKPKNYRAGPMPKARR